MPLGKSPGTARSVLITGASSGLGFEAAAQLAEASYDRIVIACRSVAKAEEARSRLVERVGRDVFEPLAIDVSSIASANLAADEFVARGQPVGQLLLNAGIVPGGDRQISVDGIEMTFATSLVGHHILATRLLDSGILADHGKIVLVSSESARGDVLQAIGFGLHDFATSDPVEFGDNLVDAMTHFATGTGAAPFDGMRQYATTKLFSTWWAAEMSERLKDGVTVLAVSPGASTKTNATRHTKGVMRFLLTKLLPLVGPYVGMDQPVSVAAKRYVEALTDPGAAFRTGRAYMSAPGKLVGPLVEQTATHLYDESRRRAALHVIEKLALRKGTAKS